MNQSSVSIAFQNNTQAWEWLGQISHQPSRSLHYPGQMYSRTQPKNVTTDPASSAKTINSSPQHQIGIDRIFMTMLSSSNNIDFDSIYVLHWGWAKPSAIFSFLWHFMDPISLQAIPSLKHQIVNWYKPLTNINPDVSLCSALEVV